MADDIDPSLVSPTSDPANRSLVEDVRVLVDDGRTLIEAELAYQKSRAALAGAGAKSVAGWGALALALVFFSLMALVFGLVLGLAELVGAWLATLIVMVALLLAAGLCGLLAARRWSHTARLLSDKDPTP